jgi:hypothetical protein
MSYRMERLSALRGHFGSYDRILGTARAYCDSSARDQLLVLRSPPVA